MLELCHASGWPMASEMISAIRTKTWPPKQKEAFWSMCLLVAGFVPGAEFTEWSEMPEFPLG